MTETARSGDPKGLAGEHLPWVEKHVGALQTAIDVSWDHAESDVVRVEGPRGVLYLKRHRERAKWLREVAAYREWCPQLVGSARLIDATESPSPALLIAAAPGRPLASTSLSHRETLTHWQRAGAYLRALHSLPFEDRDPLTAAEALERRATAAASRAASQVDATHIERALALVQAPWPAGLHQPGRVPCHRDFTPRNWLVEGVQFTVIDFEHARPDFAIMDVARMLDEAEHPEFTEAFWHAYGLHQRPALDALLPRASAVLALTQCAWAAEHNDPQFAAQAQTLLHRLSGTRFSPFGPGQTR